MLSGAGEPGLLRLQAALASVCRQFGAQTDSLKRACSQRLLLPSAALGPLEWVLTHTSLHVPPCRHAVTPPHLTKTGSAGTAATPSSDRHGALLPGPQVRSREGCAVRFAHPEVGRQAA